MREKTDFFSLQAPVSRSWRRKGSHARRTVKFPLISAKVVFFLSGVRIFLWEGAFECNMRVAHFDSFNAEGNAHGRLPVALVSVVYAVCVFLVGRAFITGAVVCLSSEYS